jgi:ribosomal protein L13E
MHRPQIIRQIRKRRLGRGYSRLELEKAGLKVQDASKLNVTVDQRRKTAHEHNVEAIKGFAAKAKAEKTPDSEQKTKKKAKI